MSSYNPLMSYFTTLEVSLAFYIFFSLSLLWKIITFLHFLCRYFHVRSRPVALIYEKGIKIIVLFDEPHILPNRSGWNFTWKTWFTRFEYYNRILCISRSVKFILFFICGGNIRSDYMSTTDRDLKVSHLSHPRRFSSRASRSAAKTARSPSARTRIDQEPEPSQSSRTYYILEISKTLFYAH